jgi:hypothetical protein
MGNTENVVGVLDGAVRTKISAKTRIGRVTLKATETYRKSYECAAWYQDVECHPQTVDLYYDPRSTGYVAFQLSGYVKSSCFISLWCGNPIGDPRSKTDQNVGEPDDYHFQSYAYGLIDLMHNPKYKIVIDPSIKVTAEVKTLSPDDPQWTHSSVFARIGFAGGVS